MGVKKVYTGACTYVFSLCMFSFMCIHAFVQAYVCTCVHMCMFSCTHVYAHTYLYTHVFSYPCTCIGIQRYKHMHAWICLCFQMMCTHELKQNKLNFVAVISMNDQLWSLKTLKEDYEKISRIIFATLYRPWDNLPWLVKCSLESWKYLDSFSLK